MKTRHATRTVLLDKDNQIAILYVAKHHYYKIPGGGIEEGEDLVTSAKREVLEEAGCNCEIIAELGCTKNELPGWDMQDISNGFLARVVGEKGTTSYDDYETERGFHLEWCKNIDTAIAKIKNNPVTDPDAAVLQARDLEYIKKAQDFLKPQS